MRPVRDVLIGESEEECCIRAPNPHSIDAGRLRVLGHQHHLFVARCDNLPAHPLRVKRSASSSRLSENPEPAILGLAMCLAAPARVISISDRTATVDYGGVETTCRLDTLTEDVAVGDYVLIHTGFAIRRLSPEDGEETLRLFDELAASLAERDDPPPGTAPPKGKSRSDR